MAFNKAFRTPTQLTGVSRGALRAFVEGYQTSELLPTVTNMTLDYSFNVGDAILPPAAKFRSFNTESMVNTVEPGENRKGSLPPMSIRLHVDEYQQLKMMGQADAIGQKFEEYAIRNAQAIGARIVIAQAEAVESGKVTIDERELKFEIDFGRKGALTANAATAWSDTAQSDPLSDLEGLRAAFGRGVSSTTISRQAMSYLQRNVEIIKMVAGRGDNLPSRVSETDVRSVLGDEGFGTIRVNEEVVRGSDGAERPLFKQASVIFTSGTSVGSTQIGVTSEANDSENGLGGSEQAGLFSGAKAQDDPHGFNVFSTIIALPVATATNNTAVLTAW